MSLDLHGPEDLVHRLQVELLERDQPVVFMVGSALSVGPNEDDRWVGVPGVNDMLARIEAKVGSTGDLVGGAAYRQGLARLIARRGQDDANVLVRETTLEAVNAEHRHGLSSDEDLAELEETSEAWQLTRSMSALGRLVHHFGARCPRVLTTNFDPLLEVSIRRAGGRAACHVVDRDGTLEGIHLDRRSTHVVHLHGHWLRGDTLHTNPQLVNQRLQLEASIERLLANTTLVVMGYGGWDDVFTSALARVAQRAANRPNVLWCFYADEDTVRQREARLLDCFAPAWGRVTAYARVDVHSALPELAERLAYDDRLPTSTGPVGRPELRRELLGALTGRKFEDDGQGGTFVACERQPIELRALPKMGGRAFLQDLAERLRLAGYRVARLDARHFVGSPVGLVAAIADALGCRAEAERLLHEHVAIPNNADAARVIPSLEPAILLVHHAHALAGTGHGFDRGFFDTLRAGTEAGQLGWLSAGSEGVADSFTQAGLTSRFLTEARKRILGPWTEADGAAWLTWKRVDRAAHRWILEETGGAPGAVERLAERRDRSGAVPEEWGAWVEPIRQAWVEVLHPEEQRVLEMVRRGVVVDRTLRHWVDKLVALGLVEEHNGNVRARGLART